MKNFKNIPCILLLGGKGTRYSKINEPPKQLIKLSKKTLLENIMIGFIKNKINYFIFPLGNKKKYFESFFLKKKKILNKKINLIKNPTDIIHSKKINIFLFDAGKKSTKLARIKKSLKYFKNEYFFTTYGDGLANIDFKKYYKLIQKYKTNIISSKKVKSQYGHLVIKKNNIIKNFLEKPIMENPINIGYYFFRKKDFSKYYNKKIELEGKFLNIMIRKKLIKVYSHNGYFFNIDKKIDLQKIRSEKKKFLKYL